mgnify:CR=1 FL=1
MNTKKIKVCYIWSQDDKVSSFCFKNMIQNNSHPVKYIVYSDSDLNILKEFDNVEVKKTKDSLAETYNDFFKQIADADYAAIVPFNAVLNKNWLLDLKLNYLNFTNSGCISIKDSSFNLLLTSKLDVNDELRTIYTLKNNLIKNLYFFSTEKAKEVGFIDADIDLKGLELIEWAFRFNIKGYENFYLKYSNCIFINSIDSFLLPEITTNARENFKKIINKKITSNNKF